MFYKTIRSSIVIFCLFLFSFDYIFSSNFNLRSSSSLLSIKSGSCLVVDSDVSDCKGTISRDSNATIEGRDLGFLGGVFEDEGNKIKISGYVQETSLNKIILNGDKVFRGERGTILQSINVSGKNNRIEGEFYLTENIILQDGNTSLTMDFLGQISSNIELNGGSLYLEKNLSFLDNKRCVGPGVIALNGSKLIFGSQDLVWDDTIYFDAASDLLLNSNVNLQNSWTFSGDSILDGHSNTLDFSGSGRIIVERGSSLLIKNLLIQGFGSGNIFCMDDNCTITFQNSVIYLDSDYTFSIGHFEIADKVSLFGSHKFTYNSSKESKILSRATLKLDDGITFSYDPPILNKNLMIFEDNLSCLYLNGATIHATLTGMQLKKGKLIVKHINYLSCEKNDSVDEGISVGNDLSDDDCEVRILSGSTLELIDGSLKYKNINSSSWYMENNLSFLQINSDCNLYLYQNINLALGRIRYNNNGGLFVIPGRKITGSLNTSGYIDYQEF